MLTKKTYLIISAIALIGIATTALFFFFPREKKEFQLVPPERALAEAGDTPGTEVGTGWSLKDSEEAVKEAVAMALKGKKHQQPDFAIVFASSGSNLPAILSAARKLLGDKTKIYGGTSDSRAVMTNKGFVKVVEQGDAPPPGKRGLAIMTVASEDMVFGVGSANFPAYPSVQEAAKAALLKAMKSAGKSLPEKPQAILITPTRGIEDEALEGIGGVVGNDALVLGGTAGGPKFAVFGDHEVYGEGVSLAVIYTRLPVGWVFEGGFEVADTPGGVVTKVEGQALVEIDHRPALDVYDEWLGGKINKIVEELGDYRKVKDLLTLQPLYRRYTSQDGQDYFLFSHPWPKDKTLRDRSVMTATKIKVGEKVYLSHGTWEKFINRIGNLPLSARVRSGVGPDKKPILGISYICAGVMGSIPKEERNMMPLLINYGHKNAPFIATFTWGEQGHFPGIGNKHGNLLTSFIVIMQKD